ncbi:acetyl-CoA carboxylase biotin carboxyl carrier protein [Hydrogenophaga sp.]|uniref:acetyl-CoA carboxylase biotin carboxyl carrier protein n=1 Tax=Hydrogenophaga sp. TaxID=1904254 RepID=UPI00391B3565
MDIDFAELASLVALLKEADFSEFRYEKGDVRIQVRRGALETESTAPVVSMIPSPKTAVHVAPAAPLPASQPAAATRVSAQTVPGASVIQAPMLGTFYAAPKPGEPAFVQVGDRVESDAVVGIVEVMKLMNSVHAGIRGTVVAVHVNNGELVEFGQALFSVQEDSA